MSIKYLALAADITGIPPTCKLVLYGLAISSDDLGRSKATYKRLEQLTGLSERAIRTGIRNLERARLVSSNAVAGYRSLTLADAA